MTLNWKTVSPRYHAARLNHKAFTVWIEQTGDRAYRTLVFGEQSGPVRETLDAAKAYAELSVHSVLCRGLRDLGFSVVTHPDQTITLPLTPHQQERVDLVPYADPVGADQ